jgi:meso-butanediol dehydrogenase/(S,S)-butanediol dehydrogenase/diacetyl reductase
MAAEGARVFCADLNEEGVKQTVADIEAAGGVDAQAKALDVTDLEACRELVADAAEAYGSLDVLCNIAGIGWLGHTAEEDPAKFDRLMAVNVRAPFFLSQAALPHLIATGGNIVNLASTAGLIGQAYCAAYCASKHALVGMTKAMAIELGRRGVRVNAVCPGGVNTPILGGFVPPDDASMSLVSRSFLTREMQEPESVAGLVCYVASDEAYYVNGAVLAVDGGTTAG